MPKKKSTYEGLQKKVRKLIDGDAIENVARYMSKAAVSVQRVEFNPDNNTVTVYEKQKELYPNKLGLLL